jgi:hypothetical protein
MNAGFWAWWNAGWVKVTLRPGQSLTVCTGTGKDSRIHRFDYAGITVDFTVAAFDAGQAYRADFACPLADLASLKAAPEKGRPRTPDWRMDRNAD